MIGAFVPTRAPGPRGKKLLGSLGSAREDPLGFYAGLAADFGPLARFRMGPFQVHLLSDPDAVGYVFQQDVERFRKGFGNNVLRPLIGEGLFLAEGERWKLQRKRVQSLFTGGALKRLAPLLQQSTIETFEQLVGDESRAEIDVYSVARRLTLGTLTQALTGRDLLAVDPGLEELIDRVWVATNARAGFRSAGERSVSRGRYTRRLEKLRGFAEAIVLDQAKGAGAVGEHDHLLRRLIAADCPRKVIRDELITFLIAGQECTSIAVAWALDQLARHPEEAEVIRRELAEQPDTPLETAALARQKALSRALDETLRLYPPAWLMARQTRFPEEMCGVRMRPGAIVLISPWVLHRSDEYWSDPDVFRPERFVDGVTRRFTFIPFAAGPRACVGRPLALIMAQSVLAVVLRRFRLSASAPATVPDPGLTLRPRGAVRVTVERL